MSKTARIAELEKEVKALAKKNKSLEAKLAKIGESDASPTRVKEGLNSLKQLLDTGVLNEEEYEERRQQVLDKLVAAVQEDAHLPRPADPSFLPEEQRLGGEVMWLGISHKALLKYPFGKPFSKPLLNVLQASKSQVPKGVEKTAVHLVEIAHDNESRYLGFCPHFFMIVSRDTYEILNVYKYEQMRRWIFQTFLTVDFGRYESKYFMFRMEINKARAIQQLLLKYIELAQERGDGDDGSSNSETGGEAAGAEEPKSWWDSLFD